MPAKEEIDQIIAEGKAKSIQDRAAPAVSRPGGGNGGGQDRQHEFGTKEIRFAR